MQVPGGRTAWRSFNRQLTDGAGFPPFAVQTRVKFWAWYRLNGAGVFSATTDMLFGGAVEDIGELCETKKHKTFGTRMQPQMYLNCWKNIRFFSLLSAFQELFSDETSWGYVCRWKQRRQC